MLRMYTWFQSRWHALRGEERGAAAVEYGLLVALIAVAIVFTVAAIGTDLKNTFCIVLEKLPGDAVSSDCGTP
jgi:pilus assembly protein Flp/PilA